MTTDTFVDRTALVTGASSGIGAAIVQTLIEQGARVVAVARRQDRLAALSARLQPNAHRLLLAPCDICQDKDVSALVDQVQGWCGDLDFLVNNAGLSRGASVESSQVTDLRLMLDTNVLALANLTRLFTPAIKRSRGSIVNVSSTAAKALLAGSAMYSASKAAVAAFSEVLRKELGASDVRVMTVYPGFVNTEFFDFFDSKKKQMLNELRATMDVLQPGDIAAVVAFALACPQHVALNEIVVRPTRQLG